MKDKSKIETKRINNCDLIRVTKERDLAVKTLIEIAKMPQYDQDDHLRLRNKASRFLDAINPA